MDLRVYYQKIREVKEEIAEAFPVVISRETADGGKAGIPNEVSRELAAKMLVDGVARLAKPEEAEEFRRAKVEAHKTAEQVQAAARMQVTVLSEADLKTLRGIGKSIK